ncbi:MAG: hypothetical protein O7E52_13345 [Candidatus Poribacteria bacterium]|nr:hypothetical protein [Candidatus Poribacteria bacterium]
MYEGFFNQTERDKVHMSEVIRTPFGCAMVAIWAMTCGMCLSGCSSGPAMPATPNLYLHGEANLARLGATASEDFSSEQIEALRSDRLGLDAIDVKVKRKGMFGKWHLGRTMGRFPTDQGFDEWYGIPNSTDESAYSQLHGFSDSGVEETFVLEARKVAVFRETSTEASSRASKATG